MLNELIEKQSLMQYRLKQLGRLTDKISRLRKDTKHIHDQISLNVSGIGSLEGSLRTIINCFTKDKTSDDLLEDSDD